MNKTEFLAELRRRLAERMSGEELADALSYYEEYLADAGPEGEQEAIEALGSADAVAAQVLAGREKTVTQPQKRRSHGGVIALCVVLGLALVGMVMLVVFSFAGYQTITKPPQVTQLAEAVEPEPILPLPTVTPPPVPAVPSDGGEAIGRFTNLEVELGVGTVRVRTGEDFACTLTSSGVDKGGKPYELHYSVEGDVLRVWSTPRSLQTDGDSHPEGEAVITLPEGAVLERAKISIGMGSVDWTDCAVSDKLDCEVGMGNIDISGSTGGDADLEVGMGDVTLTLNDGPEQYAYDLETGMGALRLDGKKLSVTEFEGGTGTHELDLTSGMGDVELSFS